MPPQQQHPAPLEEEDLDPLEDLRQHVLTVRRHLPLVILVTAACAVLAALRTLNLPVVYASKASLRLVREPPDPAQAKYAWRWDGIPQEYLNSEIRDMTSLSLAMDVVASEPAIAAELAADLGTEKAEALASAFLSGVRVDPEETTYVVDLFYESSKAERCPRYANALAEAYIRQRETLWGEKTRQTEENVAQVRSTLAVTLSASQRRLETFLSSNQSPLFERQEEILIAQVEANNRALESVQRDRIRLEAELETIQRVQQQGRPLELAPSVAASPVVSLLRQDVARAELELAALQQRYGENWPAVQAARAKRNQVKLMLREEIDTIVGQLESQRDQRISEEQGLAQRGQELREKSRQLARRARLYENLKADVEANRTFYEEFIQRQKDISAYSRVTLANVRMVDPATGYRRVRPNHTRNVFTGGFMGLLLGVVLALVLDRLTDRLTSVADTTRALKLPLLGLIPEVSDAGGASLDRLALSQPGSTYAEAFRRARVQLAAAGAIEAQGVLLCTSGVPEEGKTLSAVNLAITSAQAGKRTLLIDGDMRGARVHSVFDMPPSPGLVDALEGAPPLALCRESEVPGLLVLPAGLPEGNPGELLAREKRFLHLVSSLRADFELIVIDSPPVGVFSDAAQMASAADHSVLVVSARTSRRSASLLALDELTRVGRRPCGVIFNRQPESELGALGYGYSYYSRSEPPPAEPS